MRISDWSSDVCSSDLRARQSRARGATDALGPGKSTVDCPGEGSGEWPTPGVGAHAAERRTPDGPGRADRASSATEVRLRDTDWLFSDDRTANPYPDRKSTRLNSSH